MDMLGERRGGEGRGGFLEPDAEDSLDPTRQFCRPVACWKLVAGFPLSGLRVSRA